MAVAFAALFVAGAGSATAARLITGRQIKNGSVTTKDIRNGTLLGRDFRRGQLKAGPQGPPGVSQVAYRGRQVRVSAGEVGSASASCPAATYPLGGDFIANDAAAPDPTAASARVPVKIAESAYTVDPAAGGRPNGWITTVANDSSKTVLLQVDAICVPSSQGARIGAAARLRGPHARR